jgi:threonine dehydrogenase-like Zn-dependent dehydrogenase
MKALVWKGGRQYGVEQVPAPRAEPGWVVVKVEAAAVCTSDFHMEQFGAKPPLILGHEVSGTVAEIGAGVAGFAPGQRVALDPVMRCGSCWACRNGVDYLCTNCRHLGWGKVDGGWADFVAIEARNVHPVPEAADLVAASLTEPAAVCYESFERARLGRGDRVLVLGDGPFGFLHAQIARALGAGKVVVAGHHDARLARIAAGAGAVVCNTHRQDLGELVRAELGPDGADIAIEATGAGPSPNVALPLLRPRGTLMIFSYIWKPEPLNMGMIHIRELNLLGACRSGRGYGPCLEMLAKGTLDLKALVDVQVPLRDYPQAIEALSKRRGEVFKAVFRPGA